MGKDLVDNTLFIVHIDILTYMVYQDLGSIKDEYVEILRNCMNIQNKSGVKERIEDYTHDHAFMHVLIRVFAHIILHCRYNYTCIGGWCQLSDDKTITIIFFSTGL